MKWVMLFLLLANGVYLAVQLSSEPPAEESVQRFPFKGKELLLLSEKEKLDEAKAFAEANRDKRLQALKVEQAAKAKTAKAAKPKPEPKPKPAPAAKPAPKVAAAPPKPAPKPIPKPAPSQVATPSVKACYAVGPFLLMSDAAAAAQVFERSQIFAAQRSKAQRKQVGYWVYIPAMASAEIANSALRKIQDSGLLEAQVISEGTKANALSIGVYQSSSQADARRRMIDDLGYPAEVEPLYRTQPQYWLDVELIDSTKLSSKVWNEVSSGRPNIRQERRKCN